jgi:hypothetical protein
MLPGDPGPPLAWSFDGEKFDPPDEAVGWRVRRKLRPGKNARTEPVWVQLDGIRCELVLELHAPADHLIAATGGVSGMYRLDAIDEEGWVLRGEPAFILPGGHGDHDLRLYPDLLAEVTSAEGWRAYCTTLPVSDTEQWRFEGLHWMLPTEKFIELRCELAGCTRQQAIEILRDALARRR